MIDWCLTALSAQTGYIVPYEYELYCVGPGTRKSHNKTMKQHNKLKVIKALFGLGFVEIISFRRIGFLAGVFLAHALGKY